MAVNDNQPSRPSIAASRPPNGFSSVSAALGVTVTGFKAPLSANVGSYSARPY